MKKYIFVFLLIFSLSATSAFAIFEDYQPSARARSMGNAYIASGDDADILFYNPAALITSTPGVTAGYTQGFGLDYFTLQTGALSYKVPKIGMIALGIKTMGVEYEDISLQEEGTYSLAHSFEITGDVHSELYFGYSLNLYHLKFGQSVTGIPMGKENTFGVDIGGLAILHNRTRIAFAVKNINNPSVGEDLEEDIPQYLTIGFAYDPYDDVTTEINLKQKFSDETEVHFGIEYEMFENFWLRTGASTYPNSISGGLGLLMKGVKFNYGFNTHPVIAPTHHVSLGYQF